MSGAGIRFRPDRFHPDKGYRPGTRVYDFGGVTIDAELPGNPPPVRIPPRPIPGMIRSGSHQIGPIRNEGGFRREQQLPPGTFRDGGRAANDAAPDRARAADAARTETARQNAERARRWQEDRRRDQRHRDLQLAEILRQDSLRRRQQESLQRALESMRQSGERARLVQGRTGAKKDDGKGKGESKPLPPPPVTTWGGPDGLPIQMPDTPEKAPKKIVLPAAVTGDLNALQSLTAKSAGVVPGLGKLEYGRLITVNPSGTVALTGPSIEGTDESVSMDAHRMVPKATDVKGQLVHDDRFTIIGIAHSHPLTNNFSGGDLAEMANHPTDRIKLMIGPKHAYALVRTAAADKNPMHRDAKRLKDRLQERITLLEKNGHSRDGAHALAVKILADELGMALYVYDSGTFAKVSGN